MDAVADGFSVSQSLEEDIKISADALTLLNKPRSVVIEVPFGRRHSRNLSPGRGFHSIPSHSPSRTADESLNQSREPGRPARKARPRHNNDEMDDDFQRRTDALDRRIREAVANAKQYSTLSQQRKKQLDDQRGAMELANRYGLDRRASRSRETNGARIGVNRVARGSRGSHRRASTSVNARY